MGFLEIALFAATSLCSLVAGFLFAFAVVVMPGIKRLDDREFIRAFQVIDGVIQNNQPLFMLVWVGSIPALIAAAVLGIGQLEGTAPVLLVTAALVYFLGVQLPTIVINIPLNNKLQSLDVDAISEAERKTARQYFESRWNRSNWIRTALSCLVSALLIILLFII